jgi:hypothetical protein
LFEIERVADRVLKLVESVPFEKHAAIVGMLLGSDLVSVWD